MALSKVVKDAVRWMSSGQSGLVLTSVEPEDCVTDLVHASRESRHNDDKWNLMFHDDIYGLTNHDGEAVEFQAAKEEKKPGQLDIPKAPQAAKKISLYEAIGMLLSIARARIDRTELNQSTPEDDEMSILFVRNFDRKLFPSGENAPPDPVLLMLTQKLLWFGQSARTYLIMQVTPNFELPPELVEHCHYIHHSLPDADERAMILLNTMQEVANESVLKATAGLSRAKVCQFSAAAYRDFGYVRPAAVFQHKAAHLARSAKLKIWSPEFVTECRLWPAPGIDESQWSDVRVIQELTTIDDSQLKENEVRAKIAGIHDGKKVEKWLDPMLKVDFEAAFRPERDFYSFKSIVGLKGLKTFLRNGIRDAVPDRSKLKHVLMLGVPGTGKSMTMQCCSGEFMTPLSSMSSADLYSKWLGETDKALQKMLDTAAMIGGILAIDEFQRFLPQGGSSGESGGVENRMLGTLLTWFNDQKTNLVLSAANNIANLPDEITRSGRVDAIMFVGFPSDEAKNAAWDMYIRRHELDKDMTRPESRFWTPADIMSCCRLAELQQVSLVEAAKWIVPSYEKNKEQMDKLMNWAQSSGCICAETGERYLHPESKSANTVTSSGSGRIRRVKPKSTGIGIGDGDNSGK